MDTTTKTFVILACIVVIAAGAVRPAIQVINNYVERQQKIKLRNDLRKQLLIEKEVCLGEVEVLRKNPDPDMSQWEYEEYLDRLCSGL